MRNLALTWVIDHGFSDPDLCVYVENVAEGQWFQSFVMADGRIMVRADPGNVLTVRIVPNSTQFRPHVERLHVLKNIPSKGRMTVK